MPLYNLDYLKKISNNDEAFINEILSNFVENASELIMAINELYPKGELDKLSRLVHKFIPSLNFVGIKNLGERLNHLEVMLLENNDTAELKTMLDKSKTEIEQIVTELRSDNNL